MQMGSLGPTSLGPSLLGGAPFIPFSSLEESFNPQVLGHVLELLHRSPQT